MNKKQKKELRKLYSSNNDSNLRINEIFQDLPLFGESETGQTIAIHPFTSSFENGVQHGVFSINGEVARHILTHFNNIESDNPSLARRNRPMMKGSVSRYAKSMREGHWVVSAPLLFEEGTGALLDGQNRLGALVQVAQEVSPKDLSHFSLDFNVSFGCDQSVQDFIDKGSSRTLTQTAKIKGLIGKKDSNGVDALRILQSLMWKESEGNGFNTSLAVDNDVFSKWVSVEPNTGETYENICRFIALECSPQNSPHDVQLGHKVVLAQAYIYNHKKIKTFIRCITADVRQLEELRKEGIDTTFSTDELSSVYVCRKYLQSQQMLKKSGGSYSGSSKPVHYGYMLYFADQFMKKAKTTKRIYKVLTCNIENKQKKAFVSFGYIEKADPVQNLLNFHSLKNSAKATNQEELEI